MKIKGFGDYDFTEEEIRAAIRCDGTLDGLYLYGVAMFAKFKEAGAFEEPLFEELCEEICENSPHGT